MVRNHKFYWNKKKTIKEPILASFQLILDMDGKLNTEIGLVSVEKISDWFDKIAPDYPDKDKYLEAIDYVQNTLQEINLNISLRYGSDS